MLHYVRLLLLRTEILNSLLRRDRNASDVQPVAKGTIN